MREENGLTQSNRVYMYVGDTVCASLDAHRRELSGEALTDLEKVVRNVLRLHVLPKTFRTEDLIMTYVEGLEKHVPSQSFYVKSSDPAFFILCRQPLGRSTLNILRQLGCETKQVFGHGLDEYGWNTAAETNKFLSLAGSNYKPARFRIGLSI